MRSGKPGCGQTVEFKVEKLTTGSSQLAGERDQLFASLVIAESN